MNQYLLLLHERPSDSAAVSPAEMKVIVQRYQAWSQEMAAAGKLVDGWKLSDDGGRALRLEAARPVASDGPYADAHDVIGGLFIVKAESAAEAERLAASCPHLSGRQWIEIRQIEGLG